MFTGLSAFPLTPVTPAGFDERGFIRILERITSAGAVRLAFLAQRAATPT